MLTPEIFLEQIEKYRDPFSFVENARQELLKRGFTELKENEKWDIENIPKQFFVIRDERSLFAGKIHDLSFGIIAGAHIDYPSLIITPISKFNNNQVDGCKVCKYGGPLMYSWLDRDLGLSGVVYYKRDGQVYRKLIKTEKPVAIMPYLAVHLMEKNDYGNMIPLNAFTPLIDLNDENSKGNHSDSLLKVIAQTAECDVSELVDFNLRFFGTQKPCFATQDSKFISAQGLDDMSCSIPCYSAFLNSKMPEKGSNFLLLVDNEEIGSFTYCGAKSDFMRKMLTRIGCDEAFFRRSFLISADVTHGAGFNYPEYVSKGAEAICGEGPAYGWTENLNTATDARTIAIVESVCKPRNIPIGRNIPDANRSYGSTIGPTMSSQLGMECIDIGVPVLSMHSIRETAHIDDILNYEKMVLALYEDGWKSR